MLSSCQHFQGIATSKLPAISTFNTTYKAGAIFKSVLNPIVRFTRANKIIERTGIPCKRTKQPLVSPRSEIEPYKWRGGRYGPCNTDVNARRPEAP